MRIAINLVGNESWMGGIVYIRNLLQALRTLPDAEQKQHEIVLLVTSPSQSGLSASIVPLADEVFNVSVAYRASKRLPMFLRKHIPAFANPTNCDVMFPVVEKHGYPFPYCGWIPDFQHEHLPQLSSKKQLKEFRDKYRVVSNAHLVVLSSEMAMDDFSRLYPDKKARGRVLKFASFAEPEYFTGDPREIQKKYGLKDHFFLVSNQFWAHKNHGILIDAVTSLKNQGVEACVVCTGNTVDFRNQDYFDDLCVRMEREGVSENFKILGMIPREDQMNLMRRSLAVIQPSLFEGWSTVVEDAKALGKPLIVSDFDVHLEQVDQSAWVFPRHDAEALSKCMSEALAKLSPGPNSLKEQEARENNFLAMQSYARNFLSIMSEITKTDNKA